MRRSARLRAVVPRRSKRRRSRSTRFCAVSGVLYAFASSVTASATRSVAVRAAPTGIRTARSAAYWTCSTGLRGVASLVAAVRLAAALRRLAAVLRWFWVVVGMYFLTPLGGSEVAAVFV